MKTSITIAQSETSLDLVTKVRENCVSFLLRFKKKVNRMFNPDAGIDMKIRDFIVDLQKLDQDRDI